MDMKVRPLFDRVVVKRVDEETKTSGGIIIPDSAQERPLQGEVVAAGPGVVDENGTLRGTGVEAGERVMFARYAGTEIKVDGTDLLILRGDEILAVVD